MMFGWKWNFGKRKPLASFDVSITRERLVQGGRIVVVDDEKPLLIDEVRRAGFSVDHDQSGSDLRSFDGQIYDVAIIDYHGVGNRLGSGQGLELLKYIRRVSPRTRLIAYTSRSLSATESEFFRLSHSVLPKDMGLGDSLQLIESELRRAFSKEHLFEALVTKLNMTDGEERDRLQGELSKALGRRDESGLKEFIGKTAGQATEKTVEIIISKLFGL